MSRLSHLGDLKTDEWNQLQFQASRLVQAWQVGDSPDLSEFLPPLGDRLRAIMLQELVMTDLEMRWQRGQAVYLDYYVEKYPGLGSLRDLPAALVYEEYRVRQRYGDTTQLSSYRHRFPQQFLELEQLLRQQPVAVAQKPHSDLLLSPRSSITMTQPQPKVIKDYKLLRRIGGGTYADVYEAEAPGGFKVALKEVRQPLSHEDARRELDSLKLFSELQHDCLVRIHASWVQEDRLYVIMDLANGGTLRDRLRECQDAGLRGILAEELVGYFRDAAEALDYLHGENVLHRDVKPANILLFKAQKRRGSSKTGTPYLFRARAKVADFGLARLVETQRLSASGGGTSAYMAPEVWRGRTFPQSDLYSLAASYVELRLGGPLFPYSDLYNLMRAHAEEQPDLTPLPQTEQKVLLQALSKDPDQRYPSCTQFVAALEEALAEPKPTLANRNLGGYRLLHSIGGSTRGEVWEAVGPDGHHVAFTIIRNLPYVDAKERFKIFTLMHDLEHRHLAKLNACLLFDDKETVILPDAPKQPDDAALVTLCVVSELIRENLGQRLDKCLGETGQGIPVRELFRYMGQAAEALDYLKGPHQPRVTKRPSTFTSLFGLLPESHGSRGREPLSLQHCAINPRSLFVDGNTLKVGDFAVARVVPPTASEVMRDGDEPLAGYAAPELVQKRVTPWTDQFSLAITYVELRTGRSPFQSSSPAQLRQLQEQGKVDLKRLGEAERKIIAKATALEPEDRYPSCTALVQALDDIASVILVPAKRPTGAAEEKAPDSTPSPPKMEPPEKSVAPEMKRAEVPGAQLGTIRAIHDLGETIKPFEGEGEPLVAPPIGRVEAPEKQTVSPALFRTQKAISVKTRRKRGRWYKTAGALVVVLGLMGAGMWGLAYLLSLWDQAKAMAEINSLIDNHRFSEVPDKLNELKDKIAQEQIEELNDKNATAWLQWAKTQFEKRFYKTAEDELAGLRKYYAETPDVRKIASDLTLKRKKLQQLEAKGLEQADSNEPSLWQQAFVTANEISEAFPDQQEAAKAVRDEALKKGNTFRRQHLTAAGGESNSAKANDLFERAYQFSQRLEQFSQRLEAPSRLTRQVEQEWEKYARSHDADVVVPRLLQFFPENQFGKDFKTLKPARSLVAQLAEALKEGRPVKALETLRALRKETDGLPAFFQEPLRDELAKKVSGLLIPAVDKGAVKDVFNLAVELEKFGLKQVPLKLELMLAKALANETITSKGLAEALDALQPSLTAQPAAERAQFEEPVAKLVGRLARGMLPELKTVEEYQKLLPYCRAANDSGKADPLTSACFAECLLLQNNIELKQDPGSDALKAAQLALAKDTPIAAEQRYILYVRGLVAQANYDLAAAAMHYDQGFSNLPRVDPWQNPTRCRLAARAYCEAGDAVPDNEPARALAYYKPAKVLNPSLSLAYLLKLADRAFRAKEFTVCAKTTAELLEKQSIEKLGRDIYRLLLLSAKSSEMLKRKSEALASYEQLITLRVDKQQFVEEWPPIEFYDQIIGPALLLVREMLQEGPADHPTQVRIAKIYGAKGKLIVQNQFKNWSFPRDAMKEAADALEQAIRFHPSQSDNAVAAFHAWHGFALAALTSADPGALRKDWETALSINDNELWGWALKGHYYYLRALTMPRYTEALLNAAEESIRAYQEAMTRDKEKDSQRFLAYCLTRRSDAYVWLANNRTGQDPAKVKAQVNEDLQKAEQEAVLATKLAPESEQAWSALGHAQEDIAWAKLGNQPAIYPKAEAAYQAAIECRPANRDAYVDIARCYIHWATDVPQQAQRLVQARAQLQKVLKGDPKHLQANYWMGLVYWREENKEEAYRAFGKAIAEPTQQGWVCLELVEGTIGSSLNAWELFCKAILPQDRQSYGQQHLLALLHRCQILNLKENKAARKEDLAKNKPRLIADADTVVALANDPSLKLSAYAIAAGARLELVSGTDLPADLQSDYRAEAVRDLLEMFKLDPKLPTAWAKHLGRQAEIFADDPAYKRESRRRSLREAIARLDQTIRNAPAEEKDALREIHTNLEKKLAQMN